MLKALSFFILTILCSIGYGEEESFPSNPRLKAKFHALDPRSVAQNHEFFELFPESREGREALHRAWNLLSSQDEEFTHLPQVEIEPLIALVNRQNASPPSLSEEQLGLIQHLALPLKNRGLEGYGLWEEREMMALAPEEIDLCRGLFLAQYGNSEEAKKKILFYEAAIDLMALQILAHLSVDATDLQKIRAMSDFIFHEMRFRFPPHSLWAKDIDIYTFLPSVIDSRRGVCLGVSILYLCLAQRLGLSLEAVTPPGHIYVRYVPKKGEETNIETTARGIHVPSEMYLGMETKKLITRNMKEVIGLAFINQASVSWGKEDYAGAVNLYEKALPYLPEDYLLTLLLGYNYLFIGKKEEGEKLLKEIKDQIPDYAIQKDTVAEDYLAGKASADAIKAIFLHVDETRASILEKKKRLEKVASEYPRFRAGLLSLASTHMQLGREKEGLQILRSYHEVDPRDPIVNYYLSALFLQRFDYNQAWKHLELAEKEVFAKNHRPEALKQLKLTLQTTCPKGLLNNNDIR